MWSRGMNSKGSSILARNGLETLPTFSNRLLWSSSGWWTLKSAGTHIYSHTSRVTSICTRLISMCQRKLWIGAVGPGFLLSQGSYPAPRDLKRGIRIEMFLSKGHIDVEGFPKWHFSRVFDLNYHRDLIFSSMFCYHWLLQHPSLVGIPWSAPSVWSQAFFRSSGLDSHSAWSDPKWRTPYQ